MTISDLRETRIYIVGAGPGNPELLTVRAFDLIKKADVILHDELVSKEILSLTNGQLINVGKRSLDGKDQQTRQNKIIQLMQKYFTHGKLVVRLKGGDPMIFGRGAEEIIELNKLNIKWEMIPGITAGIASASLAGLPITERLSSSGIMIVAATMADDRALYYRSMATWINIGNTLLIYMGVDRMQQLVKELIVKGVSESTSMASVSNVSMQNQKSSISTLNSFLGLTGDAIDKPAVFLLGKNIRSLLN